MRIKRQKKHHTSYFSDKNHGGRDEALQAAVEYRDQLPEELPEPDDPVQRSVKARSKTGVVGLNFCWKDDGSGVRKPYVQISWREKERPRRGASFSVHKWGLRRAMWQACTRLYEVRVEEGEASEGKKTSEAVNEMFETAYPNVRKTDTQWS
jgi:hypothetical protein